MLRVSNFRDCNLLWHYTSKEGHVAVEQQISYFRACPGGLSTAFWDAPEYPVHFCFLVFLLFGFFLLFFPSTPNLPGQMACFTFWNLCPLLLKKTQSAPKETWNGSEFCVHLLLGIAQGHVWPECCSSWPGVQAIRTAPMLPLPELEGAV